MDLGFLQNLQDFFAKTMDVGMVLIFNKNRLTQSSNNSILCSDYIKRNKSLCEKCYACHHEKEEIVRKKRKAVIYKCYAGFSNFAIPIFIDDSYLGCIIGGQILTEYKDENHFRKIAKELGVNERIILEASKNIKLFSDEEFEVIAKSMEIVANSVAKIAYAKQQLSSIGMNYKVPRNIAIEEWLVMNHEDIKTPLTAREFEVLKLIVLGKSNTEIAKDLFISVHTVKAHVSSLLEKLFVEDRVQVAVKAIREGLI